MIPLQHKKIIDILFNDKLSTEKKMKRVLKIALSLGFSAAFGAAGAMIPESPLLGRSVGQWLGSRIVDSFTEDH